ncbi:MAG: UDP-glucose 6-dehydrogenase [Betaproteobacteria bacterium]|nr:UDP-glucose 6-dehydrogenase [Betaproteobacteria bacterium]
MNITIVGAGYVGLVSAAGFAEMGNRVLCVESDPAKLRMLEAGIVPIHEPGLDRMIESNVKAGRLSFSTSLAAAASQSEVFFIAVGTPPSDDGSPDMSYVYGVAAEIGRVIERASVIITKSTVPVGTADRNRELIKAELDKRGASVEFDVVSNPEFLKEGAAIQDFMQPERIVIGCESARAETVLRKLYAPFQRNHDRVLVMRPREAEMTKYASNALLATKISFMNEIAEFCDALGVDVEKVRAGVGSDSRIGRSFLYAGCGYGGSCFPKDIKALIHTAKGINADAGILEAVEERNARQKRKLFDKVVARYGADLKGKSFAMWGLSFKPDTDDIREASSLTLIDLLTGAGAKVRAYDPIAAENIRNSVSPQLVDSRQLVFCTDQYEALEGCDALLLVTEWKQFRNPDLGVVKKKLRAPTVFDGRNQYDPADLAAAGFEYYGIGRGAAPAAARR